MSGASVVIPTRDRPVLLRRALESVFAQTHPVEVVVVDEASSPPAAEVVAEHAARLTIVRHDEPRGPGAARNAGVDAAAGEFIGFLDDDDVWYPEKVAECLRCFQRWPEAGMVAHLVNYHGSTRQGSGASELLVDPVHDMLHRQPPHVDAVLVRRDVHQSVRFDESFPAAADLDYMLRMAAAAPVIALDRVLAEHGPTDERVSLVALEQRIEGRRQFREKHGHLFDREAEAFFHLRLGHLYRRAGQRGAAAACFARALRRAPRSGLAWRGLAQLAAPRGLVHRMARR